jgi:hypothetical protein
LGHPSPLPKKSVLETIAATVRSQFLPHYPGPPPLWRVLIRQPLVRQRTLPDFCVVGAPKCGTSDIALSVMLHPHVIPPLVKELFLQDPDLWRTFYPTESQKRRHAERHGGAMAPYCTPALHATEMIYNLSQLKPDTKVVLVLRNPVKRCFSQWKWEMFLTNPQRRSPFLSSFRGYVDRALEAFPEGHMDGVVSYPLLQTSIYWRTVEYWIKCFGRSNVMVTNADDYFVDRSACIERIQAFVGLPTMPIPPLRKKINENPLELPSPEAASLEKLARFFAPYNLRLWDVIGEKYPW